MKKAFWGLMYLLAAALAALAVYLYILPEREILFAGEGGRSEKGEELWISMPCLSLDGVPVDVGHTAVKALVEGGFQLKFESDGALRLLDASRVPAEEGMQYAARLFKGETELGNLRYTNAGSGERLAEDCTIEALEIRVPEASAAAVDVRMDGIPMAGLSLGQVPELFPDFQRSGEAEGVYRKSVFSANQSSLAYIRGGEDGSEAVGAFGVRNYIPRSSAKR